MLQSEPFQIPPYITTSTYKEMDIRNYMVCYYTSQKDYNNRDNVNPKMAAVSSDDEGRLTNAYIIKQLTDVTDEFILFNIQRID